MNMNIVYSHMFNCLSILLFADNFEHSTLPLSVLSPLFERMVTISDSQFNLNVEIYQHTLKYTRDEGES